MKYFAFLVTGLAMVPLGAISFAQDKKKSDQKVVPAVKLIVPLGASPGATTKLTIRGHFLDNAKEVKLSGEAGTAKILNKGKSPPPDKNPDQVGDTQLEVEIKLKDKLPSGPIFLTLITPEGVTKPHQLLVEASLPVLPEKEPNDGFRQAMEIPVPGVVEGKVDRPRDVDVYRFEGKAGQKIVVELLAARHGSPVDGLLTLYDAAGQQRASASATGKNPDPILETTLPSHGVYFVSLQDAHDAGGPLHAYRLKIK